MKYRSGAIIAAALAWAGFASIASANPDGRRHGPPPIDRVLEHHAEELGLSEEVRAQVRAIADGVQDQENALRDALRAQRDALHELLEQDAPDPDAVMHQAELVGAAETELHKQRLRTLLAVRTLLTPEQRQQLVKIFEEKRRHMRERRWGGPPSDGPDLPGPPDAP